MSSGWIGKRPLGQQFALLLCGIGLVTVAAVVLAARSIVEQQVLDQGRAVADMAEHIGTWASRYGGVHVRSVANSPLATVGSALEQATHGDQTYSWKNPALIQREVSDISVAARSRIAFRITAGSVLNPANAPDDFERRALAALSTKAPMVPAIRGGAEYWSGENRSLRYARAIVASASCLRCHGSRDEAPAFLRTNAQFNGGGGFGYEVGRTAGIISVTVAMPDVAPTLVAALSPRIAICLLLLLAVLAVSIWFVAARVIAPIRRLQAYTQALSGSTVGNNFAVPLAEPGAAGSHNEVHRLALSVVELGNSINVLVRKLRAARIPAAPAAGPPPSTPA